MNDKITLTMNTGEALIALGAIQDKALDAANLSAISTGEEHEIADVSFRILQRVATSIVDALYPSNPPTLGDFLARGGSVDATDWRPDKLEADAERYERGAAKETDLSERRWMERRAKNLRTLAGIRRNVESWTPDELVTIAAQSGMDVARA